MLSQLERYVKFVKVNAESGVNAEGDQRKALFPCVAAILNVRRELRRRCMVKTTSKSKSRDFLKTGQGDLLPLLHSS